ncbi:MAG: phosphoglycerate kinase [Patescibacteria group bacterium]|nr:phosphoglycerate kinase [Patescibacteria group bacterium]
MRSITEIEYFDGVKILVRADFNVPIKNGAVTDDFRIRTALPTINFLCEKGAKVILMSHLEVKEGEKATLAPVAEVLKKLGREVKFISNIRDANEFIDHELDNGQCVLLENLRLNEGEKKNDRKFAEELASLADIFVNEAFSACHRKHASIVGVPQFLPSYAGFQLEKEVKNLSQAFNPAHPFIFILSGAKFETKLPLLEKFLRIADTVFVGGALANDIFKAKGYETGRSVVSDGSVDLSKYLSNPKLTVPVDVVIENNEIKAPNLLGKDEKIVDAGPATVESLRGKINAAKFILWNGPLGLYEDGFTAATAGVTRIVADHTSENKNVMSIVGGGDTVAAIESLGISDKFTFLSTGGGAMLDFLAQGNLPGIEALG